MLFGSVMVAYGCMCGKSAAGQGGVMLQENEDVRTRREVLNTYLSDEINEVKGWCIPHLWQSIWPLAQHIGSGPVAEIGVFEGKFLIGLCKTFGTSASNRAVAIDVFDMQQFNLDGAGVGKIKALEDNLETYGVGTSGVDLLRVDSLTLGPRDTTSLLEAYGGFRFFSVDGCHEVAHTVNDIEFAISVTAPQGIIAVDDYTNPNWPGVQEAIAKMYLLREYSFVPMIVTCNKLLLCSYSWHKIYLDLVHAYIKEHHPSTRMKKVRRFGYDTLTIQPNFGSWEALG